MCGITGIYDLTYNNRIEKQVLIDMADAVRHRGPDESACIIDGNLGYGFKRLSIIDVTNGHQPFYNADASISMICNGEIYNYKELRAELTRKGHVFKTNCDVEVILHAYIQYGTDFIGRLNGQFAFALRDKNKDTFLVARDHFGICPLFYTVVDQTFVFGSEIKSILQYPRLKREVNLTGLDQVFSFPGMVSPSTMFRNVHSLKPGHFIRISGGDLTVHEYWDLEYPTEDHAYEDKPEEYYVERFDELLTKSVKYRLNADVPVGFYLSGGLDSSLVGAVMRKLNGDTRYPSFSIGFPSSKNQEIDERRYQRIMAQHLESIHHEIEFDWPEINQRLKEAVYHSEAPLKETYNTCSLALSSTVHDKNIKVILSGEGADEFLGGYVGYRFDTQRNPAKWNKSLDDLLEDQVREKLWGDADFFYEKQYHEFTDTKKALYSEEVNRRYADFECLSRLEIDKRKLAGRSHFHKRSYLDLKLRLSDHLISDHCDRVSYAYSVEGRYPFLDIDLVEFLRTVPTWMKLNGLTEKYILRQMAGKLLPREILDRQKFGFVAPGSPHLIRNNIDWINDLLSYDRIKRQGYFNPDVIERLKKMYAEEGFRLNLPYDDDLLIVVLTFNIFLEVFDMPDLA